MEHKALAGVEIKDAEKGIVEAVFSTFNVIDSDKDVTLPGAFEDGAPVRMSAYGHTSWHGELPVGRGVIRVGEKDAVLEGQFFLKAAHARETFEVVKEMGDLQEWSYGYDVLATGELTDEWKEQGAERVLSKLYVPEVSPVLRGAGVDTRTLSVKAEAEPLTYNDLKQGFEVQTLIFPKAKWDSLADARAWARDHDFSSGSVDETDTSWRFRQADPDSFTRLRTICVNPGDVSASSDSCRVQAVGGPRRESSSLTVEPVVVDQFLRFQHGRFLRIVGEVG